MQCKNTKIFSLFEMYFYLKKFIFSHFRKVFAGISTDSPSLISPVTNPVLGNKKSPQIILTKIA